MDRTLSDTTHVDEPCRTKEQVVLLQLLGMNDAEITANRDSVRVCLICTLELLVLLFSKVGHGALKFGNNRTGCKRSGGKNAEFGLASSMRVSRCMRDFYRATRQIELEIPRSMAEGVKLETGSPTLMHESHARSKSVQLLLVVG